MVKKIFNIKSYVFVTFYIFKFFAYLIFSNTNFPFYFMDLCMDMLLIFTLVIFFALWLIVLSSGILQGLLLSNW